MFSRLLRHVVLDGRLRMIDSRGKAHEFAGSSDGPDITIRLHSRATALKLFFRPQLYLGEAYMDGTLTIEDGTLYDFLDLLGRNFCHLESHPLHGIWLRHPTLFRGLQQYNPISRARRNAAHHYDLSGALYDLFLDSDRQYSCAYFMSDNDDLETAQHNKKRHLAAKLLLSPGQKVLDIGAGWGGLGLALAKSADVDVTGLTLSKEQCKAATARAKESGLARRAHFHLRDYREETGTYDRIVSVGMFEHVGVGHYGEFFGKVRDLLAEDGVMLLHAIGRMEPPFKANPWMDKYIFPGGYTPALSEVVTAVEKSGLWITDVEILRLHYAETLREWRRRFVANRDQVEAIYDERFCRMWEFYLASCEVSFRHLQQMVFQMQITRRQDAVPLTRDYITDWERSNEGDESMVA